MEVVMAKCTTYRSHGMVNRDDDKVRVVLDMNYTDFSRFRRTLQENDIIIITKEDQVKV